MMYTIPFTAEPNQTCQSSVAAMAEIPFLIQMGNVSIREIRKSAREQFRNLMLQLDSIANDIYLKSCVDPDQVYNECHESACHSGTTSSFIRNALSLIAEIQHELCRLEHEINASNGWNQDNMVCSG
jgi:hypothetical protein